MIRRAVAADAPALAGMLRALNDEPGLEPGLITPEGVARDLIGDPRALVLVAAPEGVPQGFATAHPCYDSGTSRWGTFLNDLYVLPSSRRRGLGRALVGAVAEATLREGGAFVWWDADEGDELALRFHRGIGAREEATSSFLLAGPGLARLAAGRG
ncbi:GNAT family N-acetyltransferase [Roseomonas populi]|uniref:GNAT family N-acetyltransferase n=1 Tax=Roseomonas populi TaxID=3121582 RepID=A0ABT1X8H8_9PROT|nr:GNAT family N-acetyltransferase [Roseomonas pecuniae]MCR0984417.1 GNAT family N-acetyltransferase [Roseomonas pecuniae]